MKILFTGLIFILITSTSVACENSLKRVLSHALQTVERNYDRIGENCFQAAQYGRSRGRQGCYPPEVFTLRGILEGTFKSAEKICETQCSSTNQLEKCDFLLNQDNLRQVGIYGALEIL